MSAIESESEFVEVVFQMRTADRPLMCAQYPSLEQRCYAMNSGQKCDSILFVRSHNYQFVLIILHGTIRSPAVGSHNAARVDCVSNETVQFFSRSIRNSLESNPS